jgi:adenylate cyclase
MQVDDQSELISSLEITAITGISRATLNNYIKYGLLPKPEIRKPSGTTKTKKVGYFPKNVLDILERVKKMKKDGQSMETIISQVNESSSSENMNQLERELKEMQASAQTKGCKTLTDPWKNNVTLTINDIKCPAYLINNNFEIDWINDEAEEKLFNRQIRFIKDSYSRNIFKLFVEMGYLNDNQNMDNLLLFHMSLFKSRLPKSNMIKLFQGITPREIEKYENIYDKASNACKDCVTQTYVTLERGENGLTAYHLYFMQFREGTLILYEKMDNLMQGIAEILTNRSWVINDLLQQRLPTLTSFSVLVADLQDSIRICAELPPEEYFELVNSIWKCMECSFKKYYGTYGKHSGDGMVYYFLKDRDSNYLMNAIMCAIEVRENMKKLNMDWKLRKGWHNELYLNIGINEGQEYFGTIPASTNIEFTALGDTVNIAGRLSDFAYRGSIWTTKNLMNHLSHEERKTMRYGIKRKDDDREVFVENIFSRIIDMIPILEHKSSKYMDIATISVAELIEVIKQ